MTSDELLLFYPLIFVLLIWPKRIAYKNIKLKSSQIRFANTKRGRIYTANTYLHLQYYISVQLPDLLHYMSSTSISCNKCLYISLTTEEMQFETFYIYATTEEMYSYYVDINPANGRIFFTVFSATSKMYLNHCTTALHLSVMYNYQM